MKVSSRLACLSAAALAALYGGNASFGQTLTWDADPGTSGVQDGTGTWDLTSPNWYTGTANTVWDNATPASAVFGNSTTAAVAGTSPSEVVLGANINVNNLTFGNAADGGYYLIEDFSGNNYTLTLSGNVTKNGNAGGVALTNPGGVILTAGTHTFSLADTGGDAAELAIAGPITGAGGITLDNNTFQQWGTLAVQGSNSFSGGTNVNKGRLVIDSSTSLGAGSININETALGGGVLNVGGGGITPAGNVTLNNAITITRHTYATPTGGTADQFNDYTDALVSGNSGPQHTTTFNNLTIDSVDGRVAAQTSTVNLPNTVLAGANAGTASVLTLDGDFAGTINLGGNNSGANAVGALRMIGGVEVNFTNLNNLGGAGKTLTMNGGTLHVPAGITSDSQLNISTIGFGGGFDVDAGNSFTFGNVYTGGGISKRGTGTLNITGSSNFAGGGQSFFDGGVVNISAGSLQIGSMHLRSPIVNITGNVVANNGYNSFGQDTFGTNGGPDQATVNISGNGSYTATTGDDFNVSDNQNTSGTINISGNGALTVGGLLFVGRNRGATGIINQSGGTLTLNRTGNFTMILGDGRGGSGSITTSATGFYNLSGGVFTSAGEVYAGEGNTDTGGNGVRVPGRGTWNQTGGTASVNNWFVVGREGAIGTFNMSAGTFNHNGGNMSMGDSGVAGGGTDIINITGTSVVNDIAGEFWVGNGGAAALLTQADTATVTVNNWLAVGRGGGSVGTYNMSGGTLTKSVGSGGFLAIGSGGAGYFNQTGGVVNSDGNRFAEASAGTINISAGTDTFTGETSIGYNGVANFTVSGTANVTLPDTQFGRGGGTAGGTLNLNGGNVTANSFTVGSGATGPHVVNFNGGTLTAGADTANFVGTLMTSVVSTGGAKINTNGHAVTYNSVLTHDATLTGADGGLTKSGAGTLSVTGASTYTGATTVLSGTLRPTYSATAASASTPILSGAGANIQSGQIVFDYTGSTSPVALVKTALTGSYSSNFSTGQLRSSTAAAGTRGLGYADDGTSTVTVKATYYGDANLDGRVDAADFVLLSNNFGGANTSWNQGNFNYDGSTNAADFVLLSNNFGATVSGAATPMSADEISQFNTMAVNFGFSDSQIAAWDARIAAVPEPTSLMALGFGAAGLMARRRRKDRVN